MISEIKKNFPELNDAIDAIVDTMRSGREISNDQILDALLAIKAILEEVK
jgi:hypothetical protein